MLLINGRDRRPLEATLAKFQKILFVVGAGGLTGLAGLLWWGVRNGLRPLDRLVADISAVDATTLSKRFPEQSLPAELQPIAARLNELLERLDAVFQREKRFTGDVAHELRTPLAELRTLAEVNLMVPPGSAKESAAGWREVKAVSGRMEALAVRLLELARADQGTWVMKAETLAVKSTIETAWKRVARIANERGISLELDIPGDLELKADPVLFELILTNLIGNAAHHARISTVFRIEAEGDSLHFINEVDDIHPPDLPFLFERFWKKDASRTDGRRHGLGLTLARDVATLLNSSLTARMPSTNLLDFTLTVNRRGTERAPAANPLS
jgi:two-component system sensor histidine kinase QseC